MIKKCEFCGSDFEVTGDTPNHHRKKYCSKECCIKSNSEKAKGKRELVPLKQFFCSVCGKPYITNRSDSKTCSLECRHERDKMLARRRYHLEVGISNKFLEEYMSDVMPKEQYDFIYKAQKDMLLHTNMTPDEAWDFGFRCWQMGYAKVEKKTNADRIRSMSDSELSWFLCGVFDNGSAKFICGETIPHYDEDKIMDWLKSPTTD